ncbi:Spy/CpxP family protein refolding chaperone [Ciceribacter thiooxidans]|uniref:Spy/CpxP family protein refolding chaperone n=1 Tax=Ciceribacter thiooxidans TaxID=1969821 RepID=A0ABV7IA04_9HYPH|nr:Spy/CpxP family protein refolding chaperone [Ciceribacter thiooxidans]
MKRLSTTILATAMIFIPAAGFAEDTHHPPAGAATEPAAQSAAPAPAPQVTVPGNGMSPGGMMSPDMMRMMMGMMGGGMMGGGAMGGGQPMASPMGQMMSPEYVEGRIAFLAAELKVTDAQRPLWEAVAEALRAGAASTNDMMAGMGGGMMPNADTQAGVAPSEAASATPLQRIELQEKVLSARLDGLRKLKAALEPFYVSLDETQKAVAGKLLVPAPMGMM